MQLPNIPPEMIQEKLLFSGTPPAVATAAVLTVGTLALWLVFGVWGKREWRKGVPAVAVLALAAGILIVPYLNSRVQAAKEAARQAENPHLAQHLSDTYKFEVTYPLVPDGSWWHWGLYAIGLALVVEFVARIPGVPVAVGHLFRGVAAGVIASAVLPPKWQQGADRWILPLTAGVTAVLWAVLDAVSRRNPGGTLAACLSLVAGGTACVLIHDGSARFCDFATFVASSLFVLALGGWILRADVGSGMAVVPLVMLLLMIRDEALPTSPDDTTKHVPVAAYWLVGLAPLVFGVFLLTPASRFGTKWYSVFVKLLLLLIPVGIAVYLCLSEAPLNLGKEEWE
jgi:hypothetical protein